jgi:hypothetical protein
MIAILRNRIAKKRNEMSKKRNLSRPRPVLAEEDARRTAERVFEHAAELRRFTEAKLERDLLDGGTFGQGQQTIAQAQADQPAMRAAGGAIVEELLEASFRDAAGEGEFRQIIAGPPGAAFPVPDEFQFPKHTAPQLVKTGAYLYIRTKVANLTKNRAISENSLPRARLTE